MIAKWEGKCDSGLFFSASARRRGLMASNLGYRILSYSPSVSYLQNNEAIFIYKCKGWYVISFNPLQELIMVISEQHPKTFKMIPTSESDARH